MPNRFYQVTETAADGCTLTVDLATILAVSRHATGVACVTQGGYHIWVYQPDTCTQFKIDEVYQAVVAQWQAVLEPASVSIPSPFGASLNATENSMPTLEQLNLELVNRTCRTKHDDDELMCQAADAIVDLQAEVSALGVKIKSIRKALDRKEFAYAHLLTQLPLQPLGK